MLTIPVIVLFAAKTFLECFFSWKTVGRLLGAPQVAKLPVCHTPALIHSHTLLLLTQSFALTSSLTLLLPHFLTLSLASQPVPNWLRAAGVGGVFEEKPLTQGAPSVHLRGR